MSGRTIVARRVIEMVVPGVETRPGTGDPVVVQLELQRDLEGAVTATWITSGPRRAVTGWVAE